MKTVKDYLFELDTTQLVDTYFEEYGEKLYDLYYFNSPTCEDDRHIDYDESVRDLSVYDYAQAERKAIYDFIKYLKTLDITECSFEKTGIIYVFGKYDKDYCKRWQARLLFKEELLSDLENCKNHSFTGIKFSEVLGFQVADNGFTQDIIYKVIAFVMWVSASTGYRQENLERFLERYKRINGKDFEPYGTINEQSLHFVYIDPIRVHSKGTDESQKKLDDVRKAIYEYEMYTMKREREILLNALKG